MWATTQKVKFSLRAAYAELTRNVAIVLGNYNQKNRTIKKTHKETIVEGQSLTLICTCHTCAYAQCLRSTFLTKPLTPPCANQGFAYAKCSYDKALIKTIQNGFWGRSSSHLHISSLALLLSCPLALSFFSISLLKARGSANETARNATLSHEMRFDRQKLR